MSTDTKNLNHSTWECQYHVVFTPKYRKKVLYGMIQGHLVFQYNPDESQCLGRLGRQLAARRRDVGMTRPSQQANRGIA